MLEFKRDELLSFLRSRPQVSYPILVRMLRIAGRRSRSDVRLLLDLATQRADYRLARTLAALYAEFGKTITFGRREIANMAGTSPETVSRFVSRLRQMGVIQTSRRRLTVIEPGELERFAGMVLTD